MTMKGSIKPNHMPVNLYKWLVLGMPPLTPTKVSGIEEELEVVTLPDRTQASGGQTKPGEFTVMIPLHHTVEYAAMEAWYKAGQEPVLPGYKRAGTLVFQAIDGTALRSFSLIGMFVSKRKLPDGEMKNEGEMAEAEYTIKFDNVLPI